MSKGYWRIFVALGLASLLIGVAAVFLYAEDQYARRADAAHHDRDDAYREAQEACDSKTGTIDKLYCVLDEVNATEERKRDQHDLKAQQDMALFALAMSILTFISLGIGLAGVIYVARSLNLTRELFLQEQRPWIEESLRIDPSDHFYSGAHVVVRATLLLRNVGKLPAVRMNVHWVGEAHEWSDSTEIHLNDSIKKAAITERPSGRSLIPSAETIDRHTFEIRNLGFSGDQFQARAIWVFGFVQFSFAGSDSPHAMPFAWQIGANVEMKDNAIKSVIQGYERQALNIQPT